MPIFLESKYSFVFYAVNSLSSQENKEMTCRGNNKHDHYYWQHYYYHKDTIHILNIQEIWRQLGIWQRIQEIGIRFGYIVIK